MALDWNEIIITNDDEVVNGKVRDRMILVTGEKGEDGTDGRGIVSVRRTGRSGNLYYFTIEYTDGTKSVFEIDVPQGGGGGGSGINTLVFAEDFNPNRHYDVGDYVWYDSDLWRFEQEHQAETPWNPWIADQKTITYEFVDYLHLNGIFGEIIAPEFDKNEAYSVGDYVIHDNKLYIFASNHIAGAIWDSSLVIEKNITEQFIDYYKLNSRLDKYAKTNVIAEDFDAQESYGVGDYVYFNEKLYRFIQPHVGTAWNSAHVVEVTVCGELPLGLSSKADKSSIAREFRKNRNYEAGDYVYYGNELYKFAVAHTAGDWDYSQVVGIALTDELLREAPFDGMIYGRRNGEWTIVNTGEKQPLTLYVDCLNGSDSNDGGIEHPFATLQKAFSEMEDNTGSIHIVRTGTFTGNDITITENVTVYLEDHITVDFDIYISGRAHVTFTSSAIAFGKTINFTTGHSLEISYADVNFNYVNLNTSSAIEITNGYLFSDSTYTMYTTSTSEGSNNRGLTIVDNSKVYFENLDLTCRMGYWIDEGSVLAYGNLTKVTQVSDVVRAGSRVHHGNFIDIGDAPSDNKTYGRNNGNWTEIPTDNATWGNITGDLSDQTDLIQYIDDEVNNPYYYVVNGSTGSDSNDGKTAEHPLATIQAAINKIPDNKIGRIVIVEGTYNELLTINKKNITFACGNTTVTLPASGTTHSITNSIVQIEKNGNGAKTFTFTGYLQITNSVLISDIDVTVDDQTLSNPVSSLVDVTASKMIVRYCTLISKNATIFLNAKDGSNVYLGYYTATDMSGASQSNFTAITASKGSIVSYMQLNGVQTKSEVTGGKIFPETINYYTKSETDMKLALKASVADLNTKAPMNSPELTGTPTAPTATEGTKTTQIATTAFVDRAIEDFSVVVSGEEVVDSGAEVEITSVDNGISVMWTPEYPPYNTRASQEQRWWTGGKINSFVVYLNPTYSELPPSITDVADWSRKYVSTSDGVLEWNLDEPICGGILNPLTGQLKITWGYIDSYNGETLTGKWRSSLEAYVEGTSPSIGAKVAYELAIPIITSATRNDIDSDFTEITPEMVGDKLASQVFFSTGNDLAIGVTTIYDQQTEMKIKDYIDSQDATKQDVLTFDDVPTANSNNPVKSGGVKTALDTKQDTLTFDTVPTENSTNPVTSNGIKTALDGKSDPVTGSASGSVVTLTDATDAPVSDMVVAIEPVQSGSGDPSPSNVRAITGWDACKVASTGKNLLNVNAYDAIQSPTTVTNGIVSITTMNCYVQWIIPVKSGNYNMSYTVAGLSTGVSVFMQAYALDGTSMDKRAGKGNTDGTASNYFTITDQTKVRIRIYTSATSETPVTISNIQLELGSTATAYEPYQGQTVTIDLDGTRYGGVLDVLKGELTVDRGIVYLKDLSWTLNTAISNTFNTVFYQRKGYTSFARAKNGKNLSNFYTLCDSAIIPQDPNSLLNHSNGFAFGVSSSGTNKNIYVKDDRATTVAEATALFTAENPYIVYELAEPLTVQLTPTEVRTLLGLNNIWADTGDVSLTYWKEAGEGIAEAVSNTSANAKLSDEQTRKMITVSEASMTTTKNYVTGDLLIANNQLLRAKSNISSGTTITIGTSGNTEVVDLATVISELSARVSALES